MSKSVAKQNNVLAVVEGLQYDPTRFELIRCYDNEEVFRSDFDSDAEYVDAVAKSTRNAYANLRETDTKRSVLKIWGHTTFTTVECSKTLRKKAQINVDKKIYTDKQFDKNHNYICNTQAKAIALANDFINQVDAMLTETTTVTTETANVSVSA